VDSTDDVVTEALNQGTDTVQSSVDYQLGDDIENLTLTGTAQAALGNGLDNVLTGQASGNILVGGAGNDMLVGGEGADELYGQEGNDTLYAGAVAGSESPIDVLVGGAGNDIYYVGSQDDQVIEWAGQGTDSVVVDSSAGYYLSNDYEIENLTLLGSTPLGVGNNLGNLIIGSAAGNMLMGGNGNDTLEGGAGTDILVGGAGADVFRIRAGTGVDVITDYRVSGSDSVELLNAAGNATIGAVVVQSAGSDARILLSGGDVVLVLNRAASQFTAADFNLSNAATAVTGTASADFLLGGSGNNTLLGGAGADTLTGGLGTDHFVISTSGHSDITLATADLINDFLSGTDLLRLGLAGTSTNFSESPLPVSDFTAAQAASNAALQTLNTGPGNTDAQLYNFQFDATNGYLFVDRNSDGVADEVIVLVGIDNTEIVHTDIGGP